jgi:O-succinylbenzoic acid--CoA ligase
MDTGPNWLMRRAERTPNRLALVADGRRWTFAELLAESAGVASGLRAAGVGPGERVAIWAVNGSDFVVALGAVTLLGATAVPLNTRLTPAEATWQLADARPRLVVHDAALADRAVASAAAVGVPTRAARALRAAAAGVRRVGGADGDPPNLDAAAVHSVVYTSGTSGRPKGALVTYGNLWHGAVAHAMTLGSASDDRWLSCLPLFHVSGLAMLTRSWLYGLPVVVHDRFDAARVNRAIDEEGVTALSVVATALARMLDERGGRPYPPSLRLVLVGGGPTPPALVERALAQGVPIATTYGLTETAAQAATLPPWEAADHVGSAGRPLLPLELRVVDVEDGARTLAPGEVVRGPTVTPGYLGQPEATRRALRDGWLYTGDLGWLDADGYLFVADRREDLIVTGGENVYPAEVEAVLASHPDVEEAAVVGLPDPLWGRVVAAAVVARPGREPNPADLERHCAERLAGYKVPRRLRVVAELPHTASGKLRRVAVREGWPLDG